MTPDYLMPCPNQSEHAGEPTDYHRWQEWASRMAKTHTQHRCPGCGFWRVWRPRSQRELLAMTSTAPLADQPSEETNEGGP